MNNELLGKNNNTTQTMKYKMIWTMSKSSMTLDIL